MFIGSTTENTQHFFDDINDYGFDLGGADRVLELLCHVLVQVDVRCQTSMNKKHIDY